METISQYSAEEDKPSSYLDIVNQSRDRRGTPSVLDWTKPEEQVSTSGVDAASGTGTGPRVSATDTSKSGFENVIQAFTSAQEYDTGKKGEGGTQEWHSTPGKIAKMATFGGDIRQIGSGVSGFLSGGYAQLAADIASKAIGGVGGLLRYQQQMRAKDDTKKSETVQKYLEDLYHQDQARQGTISSDQTVSAENIARNMQRSESDWVKQYDKLETMKELVNNLMGQTVKGGSNG